MSRVIAAGRFPSDRRQQGGDGPPSSASSPCAGRSILILKADGVVETAGQTVEASELWPSPGAFARRVRASPQNASG
jgi:hypothetical protein